MCVIQIYLDSSNSYQIFVQLVFEAALGNTSSKHVTFIGNSGLAVKCYHKV